MRPSHGTRSIAMKILISVARVGDCNVKADANGAGTGVDIPNARMTMSAAQP